MIINKEPSGEAILGARRPLWLFAVVVSISVAVATLMSLMSFSPGGAAPVTFVANLGGSQEVPPVDTDAVGVAQLTLNDDNTVDFVVHGSGLVNIFGSHIHRAPRGENGPIICNFGVSIEDATEFKFSGTCPALSSEERDDFLNEGLYVNVHSVLNPAGEIRGQIVPVGSIVKEPRLHNLWLCDTGAPTCDNKGSGVEELNINVVLDQRVKTVNPKDNSPQHIGSFEFEVRYDAKYVTVEVGPGEIFTLGDCEVVVCDTSPPPDAHCNSFTGEGYLQFACVTKGKPINAAHGPGTLAIVNVRPTADVYKLLIPNQENGIVTQLINQDCQLSDLQGHPIETDLCENAAVTIRYLEGDVHSDCMIDVLDQQQIAFRWGAQLGNLLYNARYDLEPSFPKADGDIDAKDLQFVYGRHGDPASTCKNPHPAQDPVDPQVKVPADTPTPTSTATPTATATATATATPEPPPAKEAEMSLNVKGADCDDPAKPSKCTVPLGAPFTLSVSVNSLPGGPYAGFQTHVVFDPLVPYLRKDPAAEIVWPDTVFPTSFMPGLNSVIHDDGDIGINSVHTGNVVDLQFICDFPSAKYSLPIGDIGGGGLPGAAGLFIFGNGFQLPDGSVVPANTVGDQEVDLDGDGVPELVDIADTLVINCGGAD